MSSNNDNNNRMAMPRIGFGTFFSDENNMKKIKNAIDESFEIGYNAYDCAEMYQSTKAVGERIATKPRELLWITSKLIGIPNDTDDNYTILKKRVEDHLEQHIPQFFGDMFVILILYGLSQLITLLQRRGNNTLKVLL